MSYRKPSVPKMTVGRYAGTPIDQLPNSYLRWMLTQKFPKEWLEIAKRKVEASPYSSEYLSISRHAFDQFSLRFITLWKYDTENFPKWKGMGLGTYMARKAEEAWKHGRNVSKRRHQDDGEVREFEGIRWVFGVSPSFPDYKDLITVMPIGDQ